MNLEEELNKQIELNKRLIERNNKISVKCTGLELENDKLKRRWNNLKTMLNNNVETFVNPDSMAVAYFCMEDKVILIQMRKMEEN